MAHKHQEQLDRSKIKLTHYVSFFYGFSQALVIYVMSTYFKEVSGTENVGVFYFISYGILLLALLNLHKIVHSLGKSNVLYFSILANIIITFFLSVVSFSWIGVALLMLYIVFSVLVWVSLDIILESFSTDQMSGRIRGFHLTVINIGYLVGPFLSTRILDEFNFHGIFVFLLVINCFMLILALAGVRRENHRFEEQLTVKQLIVKVWRRKDIRRIYYISFVLEFFYALMVIYTPIYLRDLGISWPDIGIIFTVMLIPFVIFQYPAGRMADKHLGEKELLVISILIMSVSVFAIYFVHSVNLAVWSIALFSTRIGAALVEILRDSYFYKRIDARNVDIINFFRTSMPVAYIFGSVISAVMLLFFPVKSIFILVAVVVLSALYCAFYLKDNKSEAELIR